MTSEDRDILQITGTYCHIKDAVAAITYSCVHIRASYPLYRASLAPSRSPLVHNVFSFRYVKSNCLAVTYRNLSQLLTASATRVLACSSLQQPYLPGTAVTNFTAELKTQWTPAGSPIPSEQLVPLLGFSSYNISYCRVEMTYNHPGQNDTINLQVWLPEEWNGRFQGVGGGGWRAGVFDQLLLPAIIDGYAAASTDGGHNATEITATPWALRSPGNVDLAALQNFGSVTLNELSIFGKMITESFYEKAPTYS